MLCPKCNREIPIKQQYCSYCGAKVEVAFEEVASSVMEDAGRRREATLVKSLEWLILLLVPVNLVVWLLNGYYREKALPDSTLSAIPEPLPAVLPEPPVLALPEEYPQLPLPAWEEGLPQGLQWRTGELRQKLLESNGGDRSTQTAVLKALTFLLRRQQGDGHWEVAAEGGNKPWAVCGVTGLAVLAFLADGHTWLTSHLDSGKKCPYGEAVRKGVHYLAAVQQESGLFGSQDGNYTYNHAIATAAVAEAFAMTGESYLGEAARKGMEFIVTAQRANGGWDYIAVPGERADSSVTSWQIMALYSARLARLEVPARTLAQALSWFETVTDSRTGRSGYEKCWSPSGPDIGLGPTAMSIACRIAAGDSRAKPILWRQARVLMESPPRWERSWAARDLPLKLDFCYFYYGTLALLSLQGGGGKDWQEWNKRLKEALLPMQKPDGSWDSVDRWSAMGGRIYSTALNTLTLESYYRYLP